MRSLLAALFLIAALAPAALTASAPATKPATKSASKPTKPPGKPLPAVSIADAESAYAQGRFPDALVAFTRLYGSKAGASDTLVALRLASLRLLRDDRKGAREVLEAL